jgi:hypothetical protein
MLPIIREVQKAGARTLREIAEALNARGIATARGGQWYAIGRECARAGLGGAGLMSVWPQQRRESRHSKTVTSGPFRIKQNCVLFDHLVGASEQTRGHLETERLRGS